MKTALMPRLLCAVLLAVVISRSAAAVEQIPPLAEGLLATEKLVADGTWVDPALEARFRQVKRVKISVWFEEQLLGDGQAYRRRAGEFAGQKRSELRAAAIETLKAIHARSWKKAQPDIRKLVKQGWWTMHWPREYGGQAAPLGTQLAYREAMAYAGAPEILGGGMVAPMIMMHGQQWQKEKFLPEIANGDIFHWSQGFSEPNAGSDLANVQTRAVEDGDDFVLNGQKIWNSEGRWADWGHYLVRTDPDQPKHRGVSYMFVDMKQPGITVRPLYDGLGRWRWSEIFLEDVRVDITVDFRRTRED